LHHPQSVVSDDNNDNNDCRVVRSIYLKYRKLHERLQSLSHRVVIGSRIFLDNFKLRSSVSVRLRLLLEILATYSRDIQTLKGERAAPVAAILFYAAFNMPNIYITRVEEIPDTRSASRRDILLNKALFKNDSLLAADTYAIHTCVSRQVPSISRGTNSRLRCTCEKSPSKSDRSRSWKLQILRGLRTMQIRCSPAPSKKMGQRDFVRELSRREQIETTDLRIYREFEFEFVTRPRNRAKREAIACDLGECIRSLVLFRLFRGKFLSHNYESTVRKITFVSGERLII